MSRFIQIINTVEKKDEAELIANKLLEQHLAACVQIYGPIQSHYWWQGKIEKAQEWVCVIKSRKKLFKQIETCIKEYHSYDVPEIITLPIVQGSQDYLQWLKEEIKQD